MRGLNSGYLELKDQKKYQLVELQLLTYTIILYWFELCNKNKVTQ